MLPPLSDDFIGCMFGIATGLVLYVNARGEVLNLGTGVIMMPANEPKGKRRTITDSIFVGTTLFNHCGSRQIVPQPKGTSPITFFTIFIIFHIL
jgi:hypothetical protein